MAINHEITQLTDLLHWPFVSLQSFNFSASSCSRSNAIRHCRGPELRGTCPSAPSTQGVMLRRGGEGGESELGDDGTLHDLGAFGISDKRTAGVFDFL